MSTPYSGLPLQTSHDRLSFIQSFIPNLFSPLRLTSSRTPPDLDRPFTQSYNAEYIAPKRYDKSFGLHVLFSGDDGTTNSSVPS